MIRNIDVLKKIKDKANKFLIISDGVDPVFSAFVLLS